MNNVLLLLLFAAFAGGSTPPFVKVALEGFPPFTLLCIRFLLAGLTLLPFVHKNGELNARAFRALLPAAAIGSINPILLFIALQFTASSVAPLIYASVPLLTAVYLNRFRRQPILRNQVFGIALGFSGVAIIILLPFLQAGGTDLRSFAGNLLIVVSACSFMLYGIFSKDTQQTYRLSPLALTFYLSLVTLLIALPIATWENLRQPLDPASIGPRQVLAALEIGLVGTSGFYIAYQKALKLGSELTASLFTYLQPIATIIFAVLLLGEPITPAFLLGGTLAVIGAGLASAKKNKFP